jgi:tRNA(fMet)-specific endonuclease VapC
MTPLHPLMVKSELILANRGTPIGPHDLMIAAIAQVHNLTLVTHNLSEFSRVPGLQVEDWENGD